MTSRTSVQSVAIAVIVTIATLGGFSATATAQDASPSPAAVPRDLYLDMPYTLGGFDPEIVMTRGAEHYAGLQSGDPQDDQTRADLASMLETVGAQIEDMESGYALVSQEDFFSFVVAIRVHGAERGTLLPAYQPILSAGLHEPTIDTRVMGDKEVMVITTSGEADENVDLYVYDAGDTLWMVQGPDDVVEVALADLP